MKFTNPNIRYRVRHGQNVPDDMHSYTVEEWKWKHIAADLRRSDFPVAEIDSHFRRKLHRELVRIVFGQNCQRMAAR
jgi:hypothetical protein